jgi:methylthioribose-1-phosphate isomerase
MNIEGKHYRTIWVKDDDPQIIQIIDQQPLPHEFRIIDLRTVDDAAKAIKDMHVRGAGLIGAAAGFGMYLASLEAPARNPIEFMEHSAEKLIATRPTAKNLEYAVSLQMKLVRELGSDLQKLKDAIFKQAQEIADEDADFCKAIGQHGLDLIKEIAPKKEGPINILTHCNAGWLAFVDYGSATAPIYEAYNQGIDVHVWVDETRPRNQGARLTAWELGNHGVPHTLIADNTGGHLMQHGMVDLVITGADRVTRQGDAANKIGTYLKALAAKDNDIPFYVALPSSTFDWEISDGLKEIEIETRDQNEVRMIQGRINGSVESVLLCPEKTEAANYGFDVTPARLISGLITERGICAASEEKISKLFGDKIAR